MNIIDNIPFDIIKKDAIQRLKNENNYTTNLHIDEKKYLPGDIIYAGNQQIPITQETIMVFADDKPFYNWSHPCRYFLYDAQAGTFLEEIPEYFPPYLISTPNSFNIFLKQVSVKPDVPVKILPANLSSPTYPKYSGGERYALLFSGATEYCHLNDLEYLYRILIDIYGFSADNIYVLNYDGTYVTNSAGTKTPNYSYYLPGGISSVWPGDGSPYRLKVNEDGTIDSLNKMFDELKLKLKEGDLLLIHTNNHGLGKELNNTETESSLCAYTPQGEISLYYASQFASKLAKLPKFAELIVIMEQCHSGGFMDPILQSSSAINTSFAAACAQGRHSEQGSNFDIFAKQWLIAITGWTVPGPSGTIENHGVGGSPSGVPSTNFAFSTANSQLQTKEKSPVFGDKPENCGSSMYLGSQK